MILIFFLLGIENSFCLKAESSPLDASVPENILPISFLFSPTLYIALFSTCGGVTSSDGLTWKDLPASSFPNCANINGAVYGNGQFVAVGVPSSGSCGIWSSLDGATWTQRTCANSQTVAPTAIEYTSQGFLAGSSGIGPPACPIQSSTDGSSWTQLTGPCTGGTQTTNAITESIRGKFFMSTSNIISLYVANNPAGPWNLFSPTVTSYKLTKGFNGNVYVFGFDGGGGYSAFQMSADDTTWSSSAATHASFPSAFSYAAMGGDLFVGVVTACSYAVFRNQGTAFDSSITTINSSTCIPMGWGGLVYNQKAGAFVGGGNAANAIMAYSRTAEPSDWTFTTLSATGVIKAIAFRP